VRIFTLRTKEEVEALEAAHAKEPSARHLQRALAADITERVHSKADVDFAIAAADIVFGKATVEALKRLSETQLADIFAGVPTADVARDELVKGLGFVDLVTEKTGFVESKGKARKLLEQNGLALNKEKVSDASRVVGVADLLSDRYLLLSRGKKDYFLVRVR